MSDAEFIPSSLQDLDGTLGAGQFPASGVAAGTYTLATVTIDTTGRVTSASSGSASGAAIGGAIGGSTAGDLLYVGAGNVLAEAAITGLVKGTGTGPVAATAGTDYVAPGGVAGGQTVYGGVNASENLHLNSTTSATTGRVYIGNDIAYFDPNYSAIIFSLSSNLAAPTGVPYIQQYNNGDLQLGCASGKFVFVNCGTSTVIACGGSGPQLGFFSSLGAAKQTVTGSKSTNLEAVVASMIAAAAAYNFWTDGTT